MRRSDLLAYLFTRFLPATLWAITFIMIADRLERGLTNVGRGNTELQYAIHCKERARAEQCMREALEPSEKQ